MFFSLILLGLIINFSPLSLAQQNSFTLITDQAEITDINSEVTQCGNDIDCFRQRLLHHAHQSRHFYQDAVEEMHPELRRVLANACNARRQPRGTQINIANGGTTNIFNRSMCYRHYLDEGEHDGAQLDYLRTQRHMTAAQILDDPTLASHVFSVIIQSRCQENLTDACFDAQLTALRGQANQAHNSMSYSIMSQGRWSRLMRICREHFNEASCHNSVNWMQEFFPGHVAYNPTTVLPGVASRNPQPHDNNQESQESDDNNTTRPQQRPRQQSTSGAQQNMASQRQTTRPVPHATTQPQRPPTRVNENMLSEMQRLLDMIDHIPHAPQRPPQTTTPPEAMTDLQMASAITELREILAHRQRQAQQQQNQAQPRNQSDAATTTDAATGSDAQGQPQGDAGTSSPDAATIGDSALNPGDAQARQTADAHNGSSGDAGTEDDGFGDGMNLLDLPRPYAVEFVRAIPIENPDSRSGGWYSYDFRAPARSGSCYLSSRRRLTEIPAGLQIRVTYPIGDGGYVENGITLNPYGSGLNLRCFQFPRPEHYTVGLIRRVFGPENVRIVRLRRR